MNIVIGLSFALFGCSLLLVPNMTQRRVLFAVPVDEEFRSTEEGRRVVASYRLWVVLGLVLGSLLMIVLPLAQVAGLIHIALFIVATLAFYRARRAVTPFMVRTSGGTHSIDLTAMPERLPAWTWLGIGPFVLLALAGIFLAYHWDSIPTRFPVHLGVNGVADRWAEKSFRGVYGPLFFGGELCVWFVLAGLGGWYGARRSSLRRIMLGLFIGVEYFITLLFGSGALQAELRLPFWAPLVITLVAVVLIIVFAIRELSEPSDPPEYTPEHCWKAGIIYYNPDDAALFVEKRTGFGYTVNLGNARSWALLFALVLVIGSARFVLP